MTTRVRLGQLGRPYGLAGALKLKTEADPAVLMGLEKVYLEGRGDRAVREVRRVGSDWVIVLVGVSDRSAAEDLVGLAVYVDRDALPRLESGVWYYFELVGKPVYVFEKPFGEVKEVREAGAQDLLVVARGLRTYLVPLQAPYVSVREEGIFVEPPPGLFE